jgi:hypothetical protein
VGAEEDSVKRATPEQVRAYVQAHTDLFRNSRYEEKAGVREETPRFLDLNDRAWAATAPLNPVQEWWHWQRALAAEDREFGRLQQAADRQDRQRRRTR